MSKTDAQLDLVPRLRFPEFRGTPAWREKKLVTVFENITNGKANAQDHIEDGEYPLFDRSEVIKRSDSFMFDAEAVIIPGEGMRFQPRYFKGKFNLHQRAYALLGCKENSAFAFHALCRSKERLARNAVQSTVLSLRLPILQNFTLGVPETAEQQKIAECLGSLDDLIAAEGRKLEALRDHKKGLMQQLFPREGETRPRLRFAEFQDAPEWEPQSIGQICEILNNHRVPITSSDRVPGPYPYFGASGIVDYVDDYIFDERLVLVGEDGAKWKAFEPTAFIADGRYWVNNHAHVLKPIGLIDTLLANYLTLLDIGGYVTGAAPPKLTLRKLKTIPIPVPPTDDEQQRIADCLASLDAMIAAQADKLDALRTHKRGLMQQLFPSPEAAEA